MSESLEFHLSKLVVVGEMFFAFRKYDVERSGLISPHDVHDVLQRVFGSHTHRAESNIQYLLKGKVEKVAFDDILHSPLAMVITNELWAARKEDVFQRALTCLLEANVTATPDALDLDLYDLGQMITKAWPSEDDAARKALFSYLARACPSPQATTLNLSSIVQLNDTLADSKSHRPISAMNGRRNDSSLDTRHVARCLNETPYLLSGNACYYDMTAMENSEGTRLFSEAEKTLTKTQSFGCVWNEAAEAFVKAAYVLYAEERLPDCANAWIRASDCFRALHSGSEEANCLAEAAICLRRCGHFEDAMLCFSDVVDLCSSMGLTGKVARYTRMLAETNAEAGDAVYASDSFQMAADLFEKLSMRSDCRACLQNAAVILVENGFATEAIQIFERLASLDVDQTYWYFRSMLCYIGTIHAEDGVRHLDGLERAHRALDMYTDVCVMFQSGTEYDTIQALLRLTKSSDREGARKTVDNYIQRRTLEPWVEAMLHRIVENVHKKHRAIEAMIMYY
eukprot:PhF_6_TR6135/c0_g1_i2/m.9104/K15296/NAPA, SNAPA, SEC17; alpha-soluble NSF attachment protein